MKEYVVSSMTSLQHAPPPTHTPPPNHPTTMSLENGFLDTDLTNPCPCVRGQLRHRPVVLTCGLQIM